VPKRSELFGRAIFSGTAFWGTEGLARLPCSLSRSRVFVPAVLLACTLGGFFPRGAHSQTNASTGPTVARAGEDRFTIRLAGGQSRFRQGETITLELGYGADAAAPVTPFPASGGRPGLVVVKLRLEPRTGVVDPLEDFLAGIGSWDGPPPRYVPFIERGGAWGTIQLNEWFRFDQPGKYRLTIASYPVTNAFVAVGNRPPEAATITSNTVEFEIVPADPAWQDATLKKALGRIETKFNYQLQQEGCRTLRFLTTWATVRQMIRHYAEGGVCDAEYRDGLFAFPDREYVVSQMEDGLLEPEVSISTNYLQTLATLSVYNAHSELLPAHGEESLGKVGWGAGGPMAGQWSQVQNEERRYVEELVHALSDKVEPARALSLEAVLNCGLPSRSAQIDGLRQQMADEFPELPQSEQSLMLSAYWASIASPAMLPVLRAIYQNSPPAPNDYSASPVLQHIMELAPAEGRALILKEMRRLHPRLDVRFSSPLPDKEIPELDGPLVENLEATNGEDITVVELIGRYATPAIFPRVLAVESDRVGNMPCESQAAFVAYAFKSDAVTGAQLFEKVLAARKGTGCYKFAFGEIAQRHFAPELELSAIAHLDDPDLEVAAGAAAVLGRYGSTAAEQPLWDRLRKWHSVWAGRAAELPDGFGSGIPNGLETQLENALFNSIETGQAWFAGTEKLQNLRSLCVSSMVRREADSAIQTSESKPLIGVSVFGDGRISGSVRQYQQESLEALEEKLAQFPSGTSFSVSLNGSDPQQMKGILAQLQTAVEKQGSKISGCSFWAGTPKEEELPNSSPQSPCYRLAMPE
jgi:hypothetical protein